MLYIIGLGNPGKEYESSRHNVGRMALEYIQEKGEFNNWKDDNKKESLISAGEISEKKITLVMPQTFMNNSGRAVLKVIGKVNPKNIIVVYDELDLPLGNLRVAFGRGSGGHRGIESLITCLKTRNFTRIRVGISPKTPSGKIKKPKGEERVKDFILGNFSKKEEEVLTKEFKKIHETVEIIVEEGILKAMNVVNTA